MCAETCRKINALFLIAVLTGAEARHVQQHAYLSGSRRLKSVGSTSSASSDGNSMHEWKMPSAKAEPNFHKHVKLDSEYVDAVRFCLDVQGDTKALINQMEIRAEQLEGIEAITTCQQLVKLVAKQIETVHVDPSLAEHAKHLTEQLEHIMSGPHSQETARCITEHVKTSTAQPCFQLQVRQVAKQLEEWARQCAGQAQSTMDASNAQESSIRTALRAHVPKRASKARRLQEKHAVPKHGSNHTSTGVQLLEALSLSWQLLKIAIPIFISRVSFTAMKVTDSAVLGHVGTRYLDATALSDLYTSSTGVFVSSRVVSTFCGQAFGAGNKMLVGIWMQVSIAVLLTILVPVAICWIATGHALRWFGNAAQESSDAGYYALVLALCLPVRIFFNNLTSFFTSQNILRPGAVCSTFAMLMNLVGALVFVLGIGIPGWKGFGFESCPWVTTTVEYLQLFTLWFVFCNCLKLHTECWPGWSAAHITKDRVVKFLRMYLPSALSIGSDFWRVAAIGAVAKTLSAVDLGVFNLSYRVCWICLMLTGSFAGAVSTKLNIALGKGSARDAKRLIAVGSCIQFVIMAVIGVLLVLIPRHLGQIFSNDPKVLDLIAEVRWPLMCFVVLMNLAVVLELIPSAVGRTRSVFFAGLIGSWLGQMPGVLCFTQFWRKDLFGLFTGVAAGYALTCVLYAGIVLSLNWNDVVREAATRSEVPVAELLVPDLPEEASSTTLRPDARRGA